MLQILSPLNPKNLRIKQVYFCFSIFLKKHHFSSSSPPSSDQLRPTQVDLSSIDCSSLAKSVILKSPPLFDRKIRASVNPSLKELLLEISSVVPEISRRFRRFRAVKPEHVLEILLGFESECGKCVVRARKIEALWGIFNWANDNQGQCFKHLPRSYEVMASMLIQAGMLREVKFLLVAIERQGIFLDNVKILGDLIVACICIGDEEVAISVYDKMVEKSQVLPSSCYDALIEGLVTRKRTQLVFRVCSHWVEAGLCFSQDEKRAVENVIVLLCREGRVREARYLLKKVMASGVGLSSRVVNEIARGYCEKKDFEDVLKFLKEMKQLPDIKVGNKIIHTICKERGVERADVFRQEMEDLGFRSDQVTFGILIGWSCYDGNLRDAFIYLSEVLSSGLKPDVFSYNAILGAMFKDGMWKHVQSVIDEMVEKGTKPKFSTFQVLIAGFSKARRFDEVKKTVSQMMNQGFIESSSSDDPLSRAFVVLGLSPSAVRLKRDNVSGFSRTEFFDKLGNGLFLDTDTDEFDRRVTEILEDSMIPDFSSLVMKECARGDFNSALEVVDRMFWWGQELSPSGFSSLLKGTASSRSCVSSSIRLLKKMPKLANQLDQETCNFLVQAYCKKGLTLKARSMFYEMLQKDYTIETETYTALIKGVSKKGTPEDLHGCWDIAWKNKWLPALEDFEDLLEFICQQGMVKEALELTENMFVSYPNLRLEILHTFLDKMCSTGFTSDAHSLMEELQQQGWIMDYAAYSHLLRGFCNEKQFSDAFLILDTMMTNTHQEVSAALIPGIKVFCRKGKLGEAEDLLQFLHTKGLIPDADGYNSMFQAYCQAVNLKKSEQLLSVMIRKSMSLSLPCFRNWVRLMCTVDKYLNAINLKNFILGQGIHDSLIIYNILMYHLFSTGKVLVVNNVLSELQGRGLPLNEVTYNFLVYGFSKCGDTSSAVDYLLTMISNGHKPSNRSLRITIAYLCQSGELGKALELSQEMESRGWIHGSVVQNTIAGSLLSRGKFEEAESFLERVVGKGLIPDSVEYDNLIKRFCSYGRFSKAVDLLNIMLKKGNLPNSTCYDSVIQGFCTRNELDRALDFHTEMLDLNLNPSMKTWEMLVHHLCKEKQTSEAEALLNSVVHLGQTPTRSMYNTIIASYRAENNIKKATEVLQMMQRSGYPPDFDTHWSLISSLSNTKDDKDQNQGFLSRLLSGSGFAWKRSR